MEECWKRLDKYITNSASKNPVSKEQLLLMYRGREDVIPWDKIPPEVSDFPLDVQKAIVCYNKLGDRFNEKFGYIGKDFTLISTLIETEHVRNKEIFLEALLRLDEFLIKKSQKDLETARRNNKRG